MTPGHGVAGRHATRELLDALSGNKDPGMFGRMFPKLPPLKVSDAKLQALADAMLDANPGDPAGNNPNIPAGFTYLGQFVDHDITLDLTSLGDKEKDPLGIENFRTPSVDLDCVYGLGPDGSPHLYARNPAAGNKHGPKLLIGKNINMPAERGDFRNDLPRSPEGFALIGDHRNDENLLVAQTHLAMLKFHNTVCDMLSSGAQSAARHLQRGAPDRHLALSVDRAARLGRAADRKGHRRQDPARRAQVLPLQEGALHAGRVLGGCLPSRPQHGAPALRAQPGLQHAAGFQPVLHFHRPVGRHHRRSRAAEPAAPASRRLPSNWIIDWRRFYELGASGGAPVTMTPSRKLDPYLVPSLHNLPGGGGNLAFRNLKRGVNLGLPSGQDVAKHMKIKNPLTPAEIASDCNGSTDGAVAKQQGLDTATPLWYYILKEAKVRHNGERLGPVGSTIISEVFVGLVHGDQNSFLWKVKNWKPTLPSAERRRLHHGRPAALRGRHQSDRRLISLRGARFEPAAADFATAAASVAAWRFPCGSLRPLRKPLKAVLS